MTIHLQPQEEASLAILARAQGVSTNDLVREAVQRILAGAPTGLDLGEREPTVSLRGSWAKYGVAPSDEEIEENRAEMFANFPRSDF
jgi:hypothetical protein